jgi:hypothetical protein
MLLREASISSYANTSTIWIANYIQNSNRKFYKATKFKCSTSHLHILPIETYRKLYCKSNLNQLNSEWTRPPRKKSKRISIKQQQENLKSSNKNEKLSKKELKQLYINEDKLKKQAAKDKLNNPHYNPYSPLYIDELEEEIVITANQAEMSDETDLNNYISLLNRNKNVNNETDNGNDDSYSAPMNTNIKDSTAGDPNHNSSNLSNTNDEITTELHPPKPIIQNAYSTNVSERYAPKHLTWESDKKPVDFEKFQSNNDNYFALNIRIGQNTGEQLEFNEGRILLSLLTSFKTVMPLIKIQAFNKEQTTVAEIENVEDIIFEESFYSKFFENPTVSTKNQQYVARLHFVAKKPFFWYKKNFLFQKWLQNEKIRLEENNISAMHCPKVGFLVRCHPRASLVKIYEERIKNLFAGRSIPEFYCTIENVSVRQTTTKVISIRTAEEDVGTLLKLFKSVSKGNLYVFVPWREWVAMQNTKQLAIIHEQNEIRTNVKSIILSGFKDYNNVKLNYLEFDQHNTHMTENSNTGVHVTDVYGNMTVTEFLLKKYKDGNGQNLFQHCFPVSMGIRELLVEQKHAQEAIELCKEIKEDMLLYMTDDAAHKIFDDVSSVKKKAKDHSPWEPFTFANAYKEYISTDNDKSDSAQNKRSKNVLDKLENKSQRVSYKDVAEKNNKRERSPPIAKIENKVNESEIFRKEIKETKEEIESLKIIIHTIKNKQNDQDKKLDTSTKVMLNEIQKNTEQTKLCTVELQKTKDEVKAAKGNMVSQEWLLETFGDLLKLAGNLNNHSTSNHNHTTTDNMMLEKENCKRKNSEDSLDAFDYDKENIGIGGNQTNCNNAQSEVVGNRYP